MCHSVDSRFKVKARVSGSVGQKAGGSRCNIIMCVGPGSIRERFIIIRLSSPECSSLSAAEEREGLGARDFHM